MGSAGITSEKMKKTSLGPPIPAVFFNSSIKLTLILFWPLCVLSMEKWGVHWGVVQAVTSSVASRAGAEEAAPG